VTHQSTFRFEGYLNVFLPHHRRQQPFAYPFEAPRSIKDMIEAAGVPHTEIGTMLVNGNPVPFTYHMRDGDDVIVHPVQLIPKPPALRFVADVHLGRLVSYLRLLGFDTLYPEDYRDEELARISGEEERIMLTRDVGLLKRSIVTYGYFVQQTDPWLQLEEVIERYELLPHLSIFSRCTTCNGSLQVVDKASIADRLMGKTIQYYQQFSLCQQCDKVFWKGSHYRHMREFLAGRYPHIEVE
jgi:uncharacterized protein with PIN domain